MEKSHFNHIPFEDPRGRPVIADIGEVFPEEDVVLMDRAAEELNLTESEPRYQLIVDRDAMFDAHGRRLSKDHFRVRVQGSWLDDKDMSPLWERVEELKAEQSQH